MSVSIFFLIAAWLVGCFGIYRSPIFHNWYTVAGGWLLLGSALAFLAAWIQPTLPIARAKRAATVTSDPLDPKRNLENNTQKR